MYNSVSHQKYSQFFETNIKNWRQFWEEHRHIISYLNLLSFSNYEKKISDKWIFSEIFFIAICILYKLKEMYIVVNCQKIFWINTQFVTENLSEDLLGSELKQNHTHINGQFCCNYTISLYHKILSSYSLQGFLNLLLHI